MEKMAHVLLQEGHNRISCVNGWARANFGLDDAAFGSNLADALKCCNRLLEIYITVQQPVGADHGLVPSVGTGDSHVASRLGGQQSRVDQEVIIRWPNASVYSLEISNGDVLQNNILHFWPVGREGVEPSPSRVTELTAVLLRKFLPAWAGSVRTVLVPLRKREVLPTARPTPFPERGPDWWLR